MQSGASNRAVSAWRNARRRFSAAFIARFAWLLVAIPLLAPQPAEASSEYYWYNVSAYCVSGTMADGNQTYSGAVAASSGLAFGSLLEIKGMGVYVVEDRGGAITWRHLDIWMPRCGDAIAFGRQWLLVSVQRSGWWGD